VARGEPVRGPGIEDAASDGQRHVRDRLRPHDHEGTVPLDPVAVQELVAPDRVNRIRVGEDHEERCLRIAKADQRPRCGAKLHPTGRSVHAEGSSGVVLVGPQHDVVRDQELHGTAVLHLDGELAGLVVQRGGEADDEGELVTGVDPARAVGAHLHRRRQSQQLIPSPGPDEDAQAARLQHVERVSGDAQELVEGRVADGHLGREGAEHPGGDRERVVARDQLPPGSHDKPCRPLRDELLGPQHHVLLVAVEKGQQLAVTPLHVAPGRAEPALELVDAEVATLEHHRRIEDPRRPLPRVLFHLGHEVVELPEGFHGTDRPTDVAGARGVLVVGLEGREEGDPPCRSGPKREAPGLDRRERRLVLVDAVGQGPAHERNRHVRRLVVETVQLEAVGQEARRTVQAAVHDPGHRPVLGDVLPRAEQEPQVRGPENSVVEVLAGVGLAAPDDVLAG